MTDITFSKLERTHFPLLLIWLNSPHVRKWWPVDRSFNQAGDKNISWTPEWIAKKHTPYTEGFKILGDIKKPMYAFIIEVDEVPVGYIQYYDKKDFPPEQGYSIDGIEEEWTHESGLANPDSTEHASLQYLGKSCKKQNYKLPKSLAAIDFYIGEEEYLGRGLATQALTGFLKTHVFKEFAACFVDPDTENKAAIRTYEKAGFKVVKEIPELAVTWMITVESDS